MPRCLYLLISLCGTTKTDKDTVPAEGSGRRWCSQQEDVTAGVSSWHPSRVAIGAGRNSLKVCSDGTAVNLQQWLRSAQAQVRKTSCFGLKYQVSLPQIQLENIIVATNTWPSSRHRPLLLMGHSAHVHVQVIWTTSPCDTSERWSVNTRSANLILWVWLITSWWAVDADCRNAS